MPAKRRVKHVTTHIQLELAAYFNLRIMYYEGIERVWPDYTDGAMLMSYLHIVSLKASAHKGLCRILLQIWSHFGDQWRGRFTHRGSNACTNI